MSEKTYRGHGETTAGTCSFVKFCYLESRPSIRFLTVQPMEVTKTKCRPVGSNSVKGLSRGTALKVQRNRHDWIVGEGPCIQ